MKIHLKYIIPYSLVGMIACTLLLLSCGNEIKKVNPVDPSIYKESLLNANKNLVKTEEDQIEDYINRYGWKMTKSGTGLRYLIYEKGTGIKAELGMTVQIRYKVNLINGMEVYNSKTDGMKSFEIGKNQVEDGLDEGVRMMQVGDKAKLIIPSHLAFGLMGDDKKIPKKATLIYEVELVRVY